MSCASTNHVRTLFTPVRSEADSRERCNSADVRPFLFKCWSLTSYLCPLWQRFGRMRGRRPYLTIPPILAIFLCISAMTSSSLAISW